MRPVIALLLCALAAANSMAADSSAPVITTESLLGEMADLETLARWPQPTYRTIQFSSYDRRSTSPEAPDWFSNADGFGREPVPGFLKVLRAPGTDQQGLYLMAEVNGPGAIVRGWSAGMNGVLRVYIDPPGDSIADPKAGLVWEGKAYDFLARRSAQFASKAGLEIAADDAFSQQDADYFPVPFARGLRITWEGNLNELHFYHLQVRLYPEGTRVRSFSAEPDLRQSEGALRQAVKALTSPAPVDGEALPFEAALRPGTNWVYTPKTKGPAAIGELQLRMAAGKQGERGTGTPDHALRGCLLRVFFDGSQRPQVEAPVGDFFGSGPGVNPISSLPVTVAPDGTMTCRFVMPYEKSARIEVANLTSNTVHLTGSIRVRPWQWDERSMYFRAKWRADHDLLAGIGVIDLPYAVVIGKGVFVGCAAMLMNPSGVPTAGGNWWGEGDEKFMVDGEAVPSTFGTGTEDYFNYSWSRPDLFDHPYCGQPLDSGPDTSGYVSNHRFQVLDAIPFEKSLAAMIELWTHRRTPGLSYARIAYHYARAGAVDDHRGLSPADLRIPPMPKREPVAAGGASGARFFFPADLKPLPSAGAAQVVPFPLATQSEVLEWKAEKGAKLALRVNVEKDGRTEIHPVMVHRPEGPILRASIAGQTLKVGNSETFDLSSAFAPRVLNVNFRPLDLKAGAHDLAFECVEPGSVALDYIWVKPVR